jgi:PAS domain-containing protein
MKQGFLEKLVAKLDRVDPAVVQAIVGRLLREKGFFVQVFEALREGVILLDMDSRVNYLNTAACRFFGLHAEMDMGKKLGDLVRGMNWQEMISQGTVVTWKCFIQTDVFCIFIWHPSMMVMRHRDL